MKKFPIIILLAIVFFQACKNDLPQKNKDTNKLNQQIIKFCYINKIQEKSKNVFVTLDFIEYSKITDLDSTILFENMIELPNGFCYVNNEVKLESYEFIKETEIILQTFTHNNEGSFNFNEVVKLDKFVEQFNQSEPKPFKFSPYKISIIGSKIKVLEEIYIP